MAESLRSFGYSLPHALADLIDNCITARAKNISIKMIWDGPNSWISLKDDGSGMSEELLIEAMKLGSRNPLEERTLKDLGRFGLGLKTASFSQCRCLTVRTKQKGEKEATRCWDLDIIGHEKKWMLLKDPAKNDADRNLGRFGDHETGTIVLWQVLDKIVGSEPVTDKKARDRFNRRIALVSDHIGSVFQTFLEGKTRVNIVINDAGVEPWDPFLKRHQCTQVQPEEHFGTGNKQVHVQPYVLPHQSKLTPDEFSKAGGRRGWNGQQGFYIYRNGRLIVDGNWLGFFQQEEHHKLARIKIDITNALDCDWKLDVRKAQAHPPDQIREELKRIASATRNIASQVYRHRGAKIRPKGDPHHPQMYVWESIKQRGKLTYRINRDHPLIKQLIDLPGSKLANTVITLLEETLPIPLIIAHFSSNEEQGGIPFEGERYSAISEQLLAIAYVLRKRGLTEIQIKRELIHIDPFQNYPEAIEEFSISQLDNLGTFSRD